MVAIAEVIVHQSVSAGIDVPFRCKAKAAEEVVGASEVEAVKVVEQLAVAVPELDLRVSDVVPNLSMDPAVIQFVPSIRSGSFTDIGSRKYMEDEHICVDDLSAHLGPLLNCPSPSAFYGVFDGHGGADASSYIKKHAMKLLFEDSNFPQASCEDDIFLESVEESIRRAFLLADLALADDSANISTSSGTTAIAALVFGKVLLVANAGDCRAVLCRNGKAVEMSQDHRPAHSAEWERIQQCGGYVDDGYLNGVLAVSRALGDWDLKLACGSPSPLIAEPEFKRAELTGEDEFLIIGCDGIWDVMSSEHAVSVVRRGLKRHGDPERSARELVWEALRLHTFDNLTVVVVCFSPCAPAQERPRLRPCALSAEALCNLRSFLCPDEGGQ